MEAHNEAVVAIAACVRQFYEREEKFRISHGSTNSTRLTKRGNTIDTSGLSHVLEVKAEKRTCLVEPNVPMDRLVEETLKHGLVPPVVMEFPGITVGGGYAGTSGESSSFKHGFFNTTINWVEMVLASGEVIRCSDSEKPDLFHGAAGAVGSLGVTTLVELQLIEAKKYVQTTFHPVSSVEEATKVLQDFTAMSQFDYVDGILYSPDQGVIVTGTMTDDSIEVLTTQCFSSPWDPWFYLHAQNKITDQNAQRTELIPMAEYLFRYDRGGFWIGAYAFQYFKTPFNDYTRWFLDDFLHTRMMYTALHASGHSKELIVQDLALPYSTTGDFVNYTAKTFDIWPLWLCPLRQSASPTFHPHFIEPKGDRKTLKPMLNIGLWGHAPRDRDFVDLNRDLESKLRGLGGMKWLYAQTFYTEDEFWNVYDRKWYSALREKYSAISLPSVYEKVKTDVAAEKDIGLGTRLVSSWPFGGLYGILKSIGSGTYVQARAASWRSK